MTTPVPRPRMSDPRPTRPDRRPLRCPEPGTRLGAILYGTIGGLIVWLLVDVLPHIHIAFSWH